PGTVAWPAEPSFPLQLSLYCVILLPLGLAAPQLTVAWALPGAAAGCAGAPGRRGVCGRCSVAGVPTGALVLAGVGNLTGLGCTGGGPVYLVTFFTAPALLMTMAEEPSLALTKTSRSRTVIWSGGS